MKVKHPRLIKHPKMKDDNNLALKKQCPRNN
jgi:hypothetical protein